MGKVVEIQSHLIVKQCRMFHCIQVYQRIVIFCPFQIGNQFLRGRGRGDQGKVKLRMTVKEILIDREIQSNIPVVKNFVQAFF